MRVTSYPRIFPVFYPCFSLEKRLPAEGTRSMEMDPAPSSSPTLPQEDKWRQEVTIPRLERVGNGVWDPPELPGVWDVIKDHKSLVVLPRDLDLGSLRISRRLGCVEGSEISGCSFPGIWDSSELPDIWILRIINPWMFLPRDLGSRRISRSLGCVQGPSNPGCSLQGF